VAVGGRPKWFETIRNGTEIDGGSRLTIGQLNGLSFELDDSGDSVYLPQMAFLLPKYNHA
jgi:hypothetical protein